MFKRLIAVLICFSVFISSVQPVLAQEFNVNQLPMPGAMVGVSSAFVPLALKGIVVDPQKPLEFQFIVDTGSGPKDGLAVKAQAEELVKYFLAGLTVPEGDLWVNLSPYEKDRMTTPSLGSTGLGRDLLAQDYILKQLTASFIYPENDLGKQFWSKVYQKAQEKFGTTDIPISTFNKVWILPDQAQVFENGASAYVTRSTLKVMLDQDYLAFQKQKTAPSQADSISADIVRQIVIPEIEKEVNTGKNFAPLRQIYQALILAKWYKETVQNALFDAAYTNKSKIKGIDLNDPTIKEQIYGRYLEAYKKGVFNYIKDDKISNGQTAPKKYFSGGLTPMPKQIDRTSDNSMVSRNIIGAMWVISISLFANVLPLNAKDLLVNEPKVEVAQRLILENDKKEKIRNFVLGLRSRNLIYTHIADKIDWSWQGKGLTEEEILLTLIDEVNFHNESINHEWMVFLGEIGSPIVPELTKRLKHANYVALGALELILDPRSADALVEAATKLSRYSGYYRDRAAILLAKLGDKRAIPLLFRIVNDEYSYGQQKAEAKKLLRGFGLSWYQTLSRSERWGLIVVPALLLAMLFYIQKDNMSRRYKSFQNIDQKRKSALKKLREDVRSVNWDDIQAVNSLNSWSKTRVVNSLLDQLKNVGEDLELKKKLVEVLLGLGEVKNEDVSSALLSFLRTIKEKEVLFLFSKDQHAQAVPYLLQRLQEVGSNNPGIRNEIIKVLLSLLDDTKWRVDAADALYKMKPEDVVIEYFPKKVDIEEGPWEGYDSSDGGFWKRSETIRAVQHEEYVVKSGDRVWRIIVDDSLDRHRYDRAMIGLTSFLSLPVDQIKFISLINMHELKSFVSRNPDLAAFMAMSAIVGIPIGILYYKWRYFTLEGIFSRNSSTRRYLTKQSRERLIQLLDYREGNRDEIVVQEVLRALLGDKPTISTIVPIIDAIEDGRKDDIGYRNLNYLLDLLYSLGDRSRLYFYEGVLVPGEEGTAHWVTSYSSGPPDYWVGRTEDRLEWTKKQRKDSSFESTDKAMQSSLDRGLGKNNLGGIDLNQIAVKRTGKVIDMKVDPARFKELMEGGFEGFRPVIISLTPIQSPYMLLGVDASK